MLSLHLAARHIDLHANSHILMHPFGIRVHFVDNSAENPGDIFREKVGGEDPA
jgi:hypothetical protein